MCRKTQDSCMCREIRTGQSIMICRGNTEESLDEHSQCLRMRNFGMASGGDQCNMTKAAIRSYLFPASNHRATLRQFVPLPLCGYCGCVSLFSRCHDLRIMMDDLLQMRRMHQLQCAEFSSDGRQPNYGSIAALMLGQRLAALLHKAAGICCLADIMQAGDGSQ